MRKLQNRRVFKRLIYSRPVVVVLIVGILFSLRSVWIVLRQSREVDARRQTAAARLAELQERRDELEQEIEALKTPRGVEAEIRERFPVVKEGEEVITIVEQAESNEVSGPSKSWWRRFLQVFK